MNKLIFRILGALASAMIVVSVFIPFVSFAGYSASIWTQNQATIYLPIMIIVFGSLGVITFSINKKTEFAYMSTGALTFFIVMQIITISENNWFQYLGVGFYTLIIGTVLTGIMTFIVNLNGKKEKTVKVQAEPQEENLVSKIDSLYGDKPAEPIQPIQPVNNVVQPVEGQSSLDNTIVVPEIQPLNYDTPIQEQPINPVLQEFNDSGVNPTNNDIQPVFEEPVNPVLQDFNNPQPMPVNNGVNPIAQAPVNPVLQDFNNQQAMPVNNGVNPIDQAPVNPVLQDFNNQQAMPVNNGATSNFIPQPEQPTNNQDTSIFNNTTSQSNEVDIFGQPINKS